VGLTRRNGRGAGSVRRSPFFFGLPPLAAGGASRRGRQDGLGAVLGGSGLGGYLSLAGELLAASGALGLVRC
jgi:hypothetical protein